ncbi:MAG: hypothetical protein AAGB01_10720 [Cyanobacteria bacterium P01_F01_bin.42]
MPTPQEPTDQELYLAQLNTSDEDLEALLSGGADTDDLIAAGVLSDDEPVSQEKEKEEDSEGESSPISEEELIAAIDSSQQWLINHRHYRSPVRI